MIPESDIDKAVSFLREGEKIARARGEMVRTEKMLNHIKALVMAHSNEKSIAARESFAYASDRYRDAIDEYAKAVEGYEILRAKREAASMLIQAWQTQSANERAIKL